MPKSNSNGGVVKVGQAKKSFRNKSGQSRAKYVNVPHDPDWQPKMLVDKKVLPADPNGKYDHGEPYRQCAAEDFMNRYCTECDTKYHMNKKVCPDCGCTDHYLKRCTFIAADDKDTCQSHGGTKVLTKEHSDKCKAASLKNGFNVPEILMCTKTCVIAETCMYRDQLVNVERYGSSIPRCLPEQAMYDSVVLKFKEEYELDDVADQIMLDSLAMVIVRRARGQKIISVSGELTERVRTSPDGSYESWMEANAISSVVDSLDKRVQAWLRELKVSKAAREGKNINVTGNINLLSVLSGVSNPGEDTIIDIELDD